MHNDLHELCSGGTGRTTLNPVFLVCLSNPAKSRSQLEIEAAKLANYAGWLRCVLSNGGVFLPTGTTVENKILQERFPNCWYNTTNGYYEFPNGIPLL